MAASLYTKRQKIQRFYTQKVTKNERQRCAISYDSVRIGYQLFLNHSVLYLWVGRRVHMHEKWVLLGKACAVGPLLFKEHIFTKATYAKHSQRSKRRQIWKRTTLCLFCVQRLSQKKRMVCVTMGFLFFYESNQSMNDL